jgi:hypothetical protein
MVTLEAISSLDAVNLNYLRFLVDVGRLLDELTNRKTEKHADRQTDRQTDIQTGRQYQKSKRVDPADIVK